LTELWNKADDEYSRIKIENALKFLKDAEPKASELEKLAQSDL